MIRNQIKVIQSEIRKLKLLFNESFEEARGAKGAEMEVVQTRNQRIREITSYFAINIPTDDPETLLFEHPESCFEVTDSEVGNSLLILPYF